MEIFISWSGEKSKAVATLLRQWIPDVIQQVTPWVSHLDIKAGARWSSEIQDRLSKVRLGIICLTRQNVSAAWILFEAGALAKTLENTFVCPYLIDFGPTDIPSGPLTQFQAKTATRDGTWDLMVAINSSLDDSKLPDEKLKRAFDRCWPDLESSLSKLPQQNEDHIPSRSTDDKIEEILLLLREARPNTERVILHPTEYVSEVTTHKDEKRRGAGGATGGAGL